jgi:hypothetical protein
MASISFVYWVCMTLTWLLCFDQVYADAATTQGKSLCFGRSNRKCYGDARTMVGFFMLTLGPSYVLDLARVSPATRNSWCIQQLGVCRNLCGGTTQQNICSRDTLNFTCICKDGTAPSLDEDVDMTIVR